MLAEVLVTTENLRVWIPLLPARFRHTKSLWAPAVDHLLSSLLPDEVRPKSGAGFEMQLAAAVRPHSPNPCTGAASIPLDC